MVEEGKKNDKNKSEKSFTSKPRRNRSHFSIWNYFTLFKKERKGPYQVQTAKIKPLIFGIRQFKKCTVFDILLQFQNMSFRQ